MQSSDNEWMRYCRELELARARRLLGGDRGGDSARLKQELLQKVLLAALHPGSREHFNFAYWLETLAALDDPATPRSLPRTAQLLSAEVAIHQQRVPTATALAGEAQEGWRHRFPRPLSLQQVPPGESEADPFPEVVLPVLTKPRAEVERALFANWLEWRATHPLVRTSFHRGTKGAPALESYSGTECLQASKRLARKLSSGQRDEFELAVAAAQAGANESSVQFRPPAPPTSANGKNGKGAWTLLAWAGFVVVFSIIRFSAQTSRSSQLDAPPPAVRFPAQQAFDQVPVFEPAMRKPEQALKIFRELSPTAQAQLDYLQSFQRWLRLTGYESQQMTAFDTFILPGPRSQEAIRAKREAHQRNLQAGNINPLSGNRLGVVWFRETWPVWQAEVAARGRALPIDRVLEALGRLPDEMLMKWADGDGAAEAKLDDLVFGNSPERAKVGGYRTALRNSDTRFPGYGQPSGNGLPQQKLERWLERLPLSPEAKERIRSKVRIPQPLPGKGFPARNDELPK